MLSRSPPRYARRVAACQASRRSGCCSVKRTVQVSINVIDIEQASLAEVVARVREAAAERGVEVGPSELVGLLPAPPSPIPRCSVSTRYHAHVLERRIAQE